MNNPCLNHLCKYEKYVKRLTMKTNNDADNNAQVAGLSKQLKTI